jgi:hypothetical protein
MTSAQTRTSIRGWPDGRIYGSILKTADLWALTAANASDPFARSTP